MKCKLCSSSKTVFLEEFKPYLDKNWLFKMYDCKECQSRFCLRDSSFNYHEEIHSSLNSPYQFHYRIAKEVKKKFKDLNRCEKYLSARSPIFFKIMKYLNSQSKELNILEVGCSTGYVTAFLQKKGFKNTLGIDISQSVISYAKREFGDFYALNEERGKKYDVIFHSGLIGCVDNPVEFLEYYLSLLTKDGVMFFNAPDVDSIKESNKLWVSTPPPDLIYLFKDNFLENYFSNNFSLKVEKSTTPLVILSKHIQKFRDKKKASYPRTFISDSSVLLKENFIKKQLKYIVSSVVLLLVKLKLLKDYSDEYGLLYIIKNNKNND